MYKFFTLLLVILFSSLTLNAQNSKEEYDKAVVYCACKIAYAYTEDFASNNPSLDEKKSFDGVISKQLNDCDKQNIASSDLEKLLKENNFNGFSKILIPDVEKAKKSYTDNINKEVAINNILTAFKLSLNKVDIKNELSNGLINKLQNLEKQEDINVETETTTNPSLVNEVNHSNKVINEGSIATLGNTFFPNWLLFVLILLASIILFIYNYLGNKKLNERIDRRMSKSEYAQNKTHSNQFNNQGKNNSRFEKDIYQKIEDVNLDIRKLQAENTSNKSSIITQKKNQNLQSKPQVEIRKLYAKAPNEKGEFKSLDVNENKDGKFYIFTLISNNEAQFEFYNAQNNAIQAVDSPEIFLFPVNDSIAALNQNAKKIITNKPGIVIKQNDKWIVKEKAQITYE